MSPPAAPPRALAPIFMFRRRFATTAGSIQKRGEPLLWAFESRLQFYRRPSTPTRQVRSPTLPGTCPGGNRCRVRLAKRVFTSACLRFFGGAPQIGHVRASNTPRRMLAPSANRIWYHSPSGRLIRPISARYADGLSLRVWARILVSRFERRSRQRRGGPSGRERRNISMAC